MKRCHCCGEPLKWPFVNFTPMEFRIFDYIRKHEPKDVPALALGLKMSKDSVRGLLSRVRKRLPSDCVVLDKPYRVRRVVPLDSHNSATISPDP